MNRKELIERLREEGFISKSEAVERVALAMKNVRVPCSLPSAELALRKHLTYEVVYNPKYWFVDAVKQGKDVFVSSDGLQNCLEANRGSFMYEVNKAASRLASYSLNAKKNQRKSTKK